MKKIPQISVNFAFCGVVGIRGRIVAAALAKSPPAALKVLRGKLSQNATNTPHRRRVIKTRLTEEEYAEFSERVTLCQMSQHNTFCFYAEQTRDKVLAYAVELTGIEKGRITGNLYELDYQKHYEHVKNVSVPAGDTKLIYENGEQTQKAGERITWDASPEFGKFLSFEDQPKDPAALQTVLRDEKHSRERFKSGDIKTHIEKLSGKEKKPSLRAQLVQDKEAAKTAPKKQAVKTKNKGLEV